MIAIFLLSPFSFLLFFCGLFWGVIINQHRRRPVEPSSLGRAVARRTRAFWIA